MKTLLPWLLLILAVSQFVWVAFPFGNADLICVESTAYDLLHGDHRFLYPGAGFEGNDEWMAHHQQNLAQLGIPKAEPNWLTYPPLFPLVLSPLAGLSAEVWRIAWGVIQLLLVAVFAELIVRLLRFSGKDRAPSRLLIYALVIGSCPVARSIALGQTSLFIAVLLWAGHLARLSNKPVPAALSIGVALFIKPFVALAEVAPIYRSRRPSSFAALAVSLGILAVSVVLMGVRAHVEYAQMLSTWSASQSAYFPNEGLFAGLLRIFSPELPILDYGFQYDPDVAQVGRFLALVILAAAGYAQWKSADTHLFASLGLWISALLLALPISWEHYLVFVLPAVAYLWMLRWTRTGILLLAVSTLLLGANHAPLCSETFAGHLAASLPLLGNLILFGLLITLHVRPRALLPGHD